jgi:thiosulfate dehydrogenase
MRKPTIVLLCLLNTAGVARAGHVASTDPADWYDGTWVAPDESTIPNTGSGQMIRYGKLLLTETYKYLGAESTMPYTGNRLACTNCHLDEGKAAFGASWAVVWYKYGAGGQGPYSARSDRYLDMKNRIHDCMQRSMHGRQLPDDSYELASMIEYMKWLATGMRVADWTQVVGQGNIRVNDMTRPADPVRGRQVYEDQCAACHQSDGSGVWDPDGRKYVYPAVWGPNSFNHGAGMYRLRTAVGFIRGNMPYGWANASDPTHQLSAEDAWDAMAYVISQDRPLWSGYLTDWSGYTPSNCMPNWLRKTVDAGYEYYFPRVKPDGTLSGDVSYPAKYPAVKHLYGPWADMQSEQTALQNAYLAAPNTPPNCKPWP